MKKLNLILLAVSMLIFGLGCDRVFDTMEDLDSSSPKESNSLRIEVTLTNPTRELLEVEANNSIKSVSADLNREVDFFSILCNPEDTTNITIEAAAILDFHVVVSVYNVDGSLRDRCYPILFSEYISISVKTVDNKVYYYVNENY